MYLLWYRCPLLLYGLAFLLGILFALQSPLALIPFFLLVCAAYRHFFLLTLLFLAPLPYLQRIEPQTEGRFHISSFSHQNYLWRYQGTLGHLPCSINSKERLVANCDYYVEGHWKTERTFKASSFRPIPRSFSLAETRFKLKKRLLSTFKEIGPTEKGASFLTALLTGDLDDMVMRKNFQQVGLSHLLAVSGFHFATLSFGLHLLLRLFLPRKCELVVLMLFMTLYYLFVGYAPSVQRAWIFMLVYLVGKLFEREAYALNTLGAALFISLLISPFSALTLSFQLSFLATGGLLLFYRPIERKLRQLFPKILLRDVIEYPLWWQTGYLCIGALRELFALTLAVHLVVTPLTLFYFHVFFPQSLIYNLFFPFLTSCALFLLPLYPAANLFASWILKLTENPWLPFKGIYVENSPAFLLTLIVSFLCFVGLCIEERRLFLRQRSPLKRSSPQLWQKVWARLRFGYALWSKV